MDCYVYQNNIIQICTGENMYKIKLYILDQIEKNLSSIIEEADVLNYYSPNFKVIFPWRKNILK